MRSLALAGALLLLTSACATAPGAKAPAAPEFPFRTYTDVVQAGIENITPGECPGSGMEVSVVYTAAKDGVSWRVMSTRDRDVFLRIDGGVSTYVYFVTGTANDGAIHVVKVLSVEQAKAAYPQGPCSFLTASKSDA